MTNPESFDLDSGEKLKWEIISGKQAKERKLPITEQLTDDTEVVVTYLARPLEPNTTNRIRLMETYADPKSYFMDGDGWFGIGLSVAYATPSCCPPVGISPVSHRRQLSRLSATAACPCMW